MDLTEIISRVSVLEEHNKKVDEDIMELKKKQERLDELTLTVSQLAQNMKGMLEQLTKQNDRLAVLEGKPIQNMNLIIKTAITAITSAIAGGFAVWLIQGIAHNM